MGNSFRNLGFALLTLGALLKRPAVAAAGAALLSFALLSYILSRVSLSDVTYAREISGIVAFFDDRVSVRSVIDNPKPFPAWVRLSDEVPREWEHEQGSLAEAGRSRVIKHTDVVLGPFEASVTERVIRCSQRGVFTAGPASLLARDPFGMYKANRDLGCRQSLTVYPRIIPVKNAFGLHLDPFGDKRAPSWVYQDPIEIKTSREYSQDDPVRFIDHKGSARTGSLKTKVFDATVSRRTVICVNLSTSRELWEGLDVEVFESLVTAASSVAWLLSQKNQSVGLCTNGISRPEEGYNYLAQSPPASGQDNLRRVLTCLAGLGYYVFDSFSRSCEVSWVRSASVHPVILTSVLDEEVAKVLRKRRSRDGSVLVISHHKRKWPGLDPLGEEIAELSGGRLFHARLEGGWRDAEYISIEPIA